MLRLDLEYDRHPAFSPYSNHEAIGEAFSGVFSGLDEAITARFQDGDSKGTLLTAQRQKIRELIAGSSEIAADFQPVVADAFDRAIGRATADEMERQNWGRSLWPAPEVARQQADRILAESHLIFRMPRASLQTLRQVLQPDIDRLRRDCDLRPDEIHVSPPSDSEATRIVNDFCREAGAFDAISAFYRRRFDSVGFVLHVSSPNDTWYHVFDDVGLEIANTTQFHFDLDFSPPKAMLYLNDVDEGQGPFSIIPKDDKWERFGITLAFHKEIIVGLEKFMADQHGHVRGQNVSVFRAPEARRLFMTAVPRPLRGSSHMGDHVMNNSGLSLGMLTAERKILGEAGTMPVFAGSHVLHRGGLVSKGERWALQMVFSPAAPLPKEPSPPFRARIAQRLRRLLPV